MGYREPLRKKVRAVVWGEPLSPPPPTRGRSFEVRASQPQIATHRPQHIPKTKRAALFTLCAHCGVAGVHVRCAPIFILCVLSELTDTAIVSLTTALPPARVCVHVCHTLRSLRVRGRIPVRPRRAL